MSRLLFGGNDGFRVREIALTGQWQDQKIEREHADVEESGHRRLLRRRRLPGETFVSSESGTSQQSLGTCHVSLKETIHQINSILSRHLVRLKSN